jgi:hypothetical protein
MDSLPLLHKRVKALEAELGAITAFMLVQSKESSKTVRDCTKITDSLSIELRKSLVEFDKSLTINASN